MPDASTPPRTPRNALVIVFLVVVIDLLGFGIVLPLLPLFAKGYVAAIFPESPQAGGALVGLLMASFSAMQFFFAPVWGRASDRVGRRLGCDPVAIVGGARGAQDLVVGRRRRRFDEPRHGRCPREELVADRAVGRQIRRDPVDETSSEERHDEAGEEQAGDLRGETAHPESGHTGITFSVKL